MDFVNVYEAKTQLSRLLRRVRAGEEIVIAAAGRPVARLVPIAAPSGPRVLGGDEDTVWVADDFNAPVPEIIDAFYGAETGGRRRRRSAAQMKRPRRPHRRLMSTDSIFERYDIDLIRAT